MASLWKGVLLSTLLLFFIFAHSQYSRATGQTLFHVLNVTAFFLATVLNAGNMESAQVMRIFPLSLLDYLYLVAKFQGFLTEPLVTMPIDIIFTHICFAFITKALTFTKMAIFCILISCYNLYQTILDPVHVKPSELGASILSTLLIFRIFIILFHKNTLCPERYFALLLIAVFDAAIGYQTVRKEILHLTNLPASGSTALYVSGFAAYIMLVVSLSFARSLSVSTMTVFAVQAIVGYLGLFVVDYMHFPIWNFGIYSVFPQLTMLLVFITVQLLCLSAINNRKEEPPMEQLNTAEDAVEGVAAEVVESPQPENR